MNATGMPCEVWGDLYSHVKSFDLNLSVPPVSSSYTREFMDSLYSLVAAYFLICGVIMSKTLKSSAWLSLLRWK